MTRKRPCWPTVFGAIAAFVAVDLLFAPSLDLRVEARETDNPSPVVTPVQIAVEGERDPLLIAAEVADTPASRVRGLMGRERLRPDQGMWFVFDRPAHRSFWMKNTPASLDILFVDARCRVVRIVRSTVPENETPIASGFPVPYVLEVAAGIADPVSVGDRVRTGPGWGCASR